MEKGEFFLSRAHVILGKGWTWQTGWIKKKQAIPVKEFPKYDLVVKEHNAKIITNSGKFISVSIGTKFKKKAKIYIDSYFISLPVGNCGTIDLDFVKELKIPKDQQLLRQNMLATAKSFLNTPYSWGGRSSFDTNAKMQTGVDCSGFINLIHRVHGMDIPRDAHDQYMLSTLINGKNAQPGDLIFSGIEKEPGKPFSKYINHVMMYLGDDLLIESTGKSPFKNRIISIQEKFGKPIHEIKNGEKIGENIIQFGTLVGTFSEELCRTITTS